MNAIGIDIGGTHMRAARVSVNGGIAAHRTRPTAASVVEDCVALVAELRDPDTIGVGIGIPGRVDAASGRILSGGFVDLSAAPLGHRVRETSSFDPILDNDANMALLAEARLGAARGHRHAVMLTIGTGIGGAILSDGRIFHGGGTAGQLGHVTVDADGAPCNCGRRGCLETTSSGTALARLAGGARIEDLLARDDAAAIRIVEEWALPLRAGIDSLVAAFAPSIVVLGGGLGAAAVMALQRFPAASPWFQAEVAAAKLGDTAGVIGAGLAALERR